MEIKKIEKVILTKEETNAFLRVLNIINKVSSNAEECGELEKQADKISNLLSEFINSIGIEC